MSPKTEGEIFTLYERIKPLINADQESIPKAGFFQKLLIAIGIPLGLDEKEDRFNQAMSEIVKFIYPELEYKPDSNILGASLVVSQLFSDGTVLGTSSNMIEGYVNGIHLKQAHITATERDEYRGNMSDTVSGYFYFMPFFKEVSGYVMVQEIQQKEIVDTILEAIKGKKKPLFNDDEFNNTFELEFSDTSLAIEILNEEVRSAIIAFQRLYTEAMYSFTHDYLWIFIPENIINPSLYDTKPIDLRQLESIVRLFEAGAMAIEIFKLSR